MIDDIDINQEEPSKAQLKRDADKLHELGRSLVRLPVSVLENFSLPGDLFDAIIFAQSIKQNRAIKRHMQFIAKLLRHQDTYQIEQNYKNYSLKINQGTKEFHAYEKWRDRFLDDDRTVFAEFLKKYPNVDRQHLRQLQRSTLNEKEQANSPKYARLLFKYIKDSIENS